MSVIETENGVSNVVTLGNVTKLDIPPARILRDLAERDTLEGVVIMGYGRDGSDYFASSYAHGGLILWLMERMKMRLMGVPEPE